MSRVLLVHWHEQEGATKAERLRLMGHEVAVHWQPDAGSALTRSIAGSRPDAVVIDLARLPSHGRAVATWMRERKASRGIPIVFMPGDVEKTARARQAFPDAAFATWGRLRSVLAKAIAAPPANPVVPTAPDYSGTPLRQKLGVKVDGRIAALRAPPDFAAMLGEMPVGAALTQRLAGEADVVVLFCRALAQLRADWPDAARCLSAKGGLWIAWPKKSAGQTTDLSDDIVRAFGLDQGFVDNKVCAIDATWSGLRFVPRARKK